MYDADDSAIRVVYGTSKMPTILDYYDGKLVAVWSALGCENGLFEGDYGTT